MPAPHASALILVIEPEFNVSINNHDDFGLIGKARMANLLQAYG